jgi:hypothetical protein
MRRAFRGGFIAGTDGNPIGIYLGADFCAEHEWGIKKIKQAFGIGETKQPGLPRRMITRIPVPQGNYGQELRLFTVDDNAYLVFCYKNTIDWIANPKSQTERYRELTISEDEELATAWDEGSFGIIVTKAHKALLEEIYAAFQKKDIVLCLGGGGHIFDNPGISIVIASKIDEESKQSWREGDEDYARLLKAAEETTIAKYLKGKKKEYYALSPRWAKEIKSETCKTQYPVVYWLNPMEQDRYTAGWYTVEDLKLWGEDKGPVVKK